MKNTELSKRSQRFAVLARMIGYEGNESAIKEVDEFWAKFFGLSPATVSHFRWNKKVSPEHTKKFLDALGDKANHLKDLHEYFSVDKDGNILSSSKKVQKSAKKKAAKKATKRTSTRAVRASAVVEKATTATPAPTPQAVVAQSEPVPVAAAKSRAVGGKIVITQVDHGGHRYQAILVPLGSTVSFTGTGPGTMITVE